MNRRLSSLVAIFAVACGDDEAGQADGASDTAVDSADATAESVAPDSAAELDTGPERTPLEAALYASAEALCQRAVECLPFVLGQQFAGSVEACTEREYETLHPILEMPGIASDAAEYQAVADQIGGADCETVRRGVLASDLPPEVRIAGALADGSACVHPFQCASGRCRRTFDVLCGTCETPEPDGAECSAAFDCMVGSTCAEGLCAPFGERGDPCDGAHPCYPHDACLDGECAAALGEGAECAFPVGECDLQASLLVCGLDDKHCMPISWAEVDQPCGYVDGEALVCAGSACVPSIFNGTCMAFAADGAACDPVDGPLCAFHASCIEGRCETYYGHRCE